MLKLHELLSRKIGQFDRLYPLCLKSVSYCSLFNVSSLYFRNLSSVIIARASDNFFTATCRFSWLYTLNIGKSFFVNHPMIAEFFKLDTVILDFSSGGNNSNQK